jgi:hypothetical protein
MPQFTGTLKTLPPTGSSAKGLKAEFTREQGNKLLFSGQIPVAIIPFTANATMTCDSEEQATGTQAFSGKTGAKQFTLALENGVQISGEVTDGGQASDVPFTGQGQWALTVPQND